MKKIREKKNERIEYRILTQLGQLGLVMHQLGQLGKLYKYSGNYADYLDKKKCEENKGKFLELDSKKIITLVKKSEKYKTPEETLYPKSKYNAFYLECQKKLKETYFENLNYLISVLEKIKEIPIIPNETLNIISEETKKIIDNMYSLCHYYYIYAIIALLNSDLKEVEEVKDMKLNSSYQTVLGLNSK